MRSGSSIDEHAHRAVGALAALHAAEHHRPEYHVVAPGSARQHLAQARWHRLAALTPAARAAARRRRFSDSPKS